MDLSAKEKQLDGVLRQAMEELNEKANVLSADPDPFVVEEAGAIRKRAEEIKNLLKK